jgi:nucleoside phosphorylase
VIDILLVAAFHPELAALRPLLGDKLRGRIGSFEVAAKAIGIGLAAAAVGTTSRLETLRPRAVVLLGTCGVYPNASLGGVGSRTWTLQDVAVARKIKLVEPAVEEKRAQYPEPMSVVSEADGVMGRAIAGNRARIVDVATTLAITTDDTLASSLAPSTGCQVEHMEAFAVAAACASFGVPFAAALGVANVVGSSAREQWRLHHGVAGDAAVRLVVGWINDGALGLPALAPR